jgi:hypothetical protein
LIQNPEETRLVVADEKLVFNAPIHLTKNQLPYLCMGLIPDIPDQIIHRPGPGPSPDPSPPQIEEAEKAPDPEHYFGPIDGGFTRELRGASNSFEATWRKTGYDEKYLAELSANLEQREIAEWKGYTLNTDVANFKAIHDALLVYKATLRNRRMLLSKYIDDADLYKFGAVACDESQYASALNLEVRSKNALIRRLEGSDTDKADGYVAAVAYTRVRMSLVTEVLASFRESTILPDARVERWVKLMTFFKNTQPPCFLVWFHIKYHGLIQNLHNLHIAIATRSNLLTYTDKAVRFELFARIHYQNCSHMEMVAQYDYALERLRECFVAPDALWLEKCLIATTALQRVFELINSQSVLVKAVKEIDDAAQRIQTDFDTYHEYQTRTGRDRDNDIAEAAALFLSENDTLKERLKKRVELFRAGEYLHPTDVVQGARACIGSLSLMLHDICLQLYAVSVRVTEKSSYKKETDAIRVAFQAKQAQCLNYWHSVMQSVNPATVTEEERRDLTESYQRIYDFHVNCTQYFDQFQQHPRKENFFQAEKHAVPLCFFWVMREQFAPIPPLQADYLSRNTPLVISRDIAATARNISSAFVTPYRTLREHMSKGALPPMGVHHAHDFIATAHAHLEFIHKKLHPLMSMVASNHKSTSLYSCSPENHITPVMRALEQARLYNLMVVYAIKEFAALKHITLTPYFERGIAIIHHDKRRIVGETIDDGAFNGTHYINSCIAQYYTESAAGGVEALSFARARLFAQLEKHWMYVELWRNITDFAKLFLRISSKQYQIEEHIGITEALWIAQVHLSLKVRRWLDFMTLFPTEHEAKPWHEFGARVSKNDHIFTRSLLYIDQRSSDQDWYELQKPINLAGDASIEDLVRNTNEVDINVLHVQRYLAMLIDSRVQKQLVESEHARFVLQGHLESIVRLRNKAMQNTTFESLWEYVIQRERMTAEAYKASGLEPGDDPSLQALCRAHRNQRARNLEQIRSRILNVLRSCNLISNDLRFARLCDWAMFRLECTQEKHDCVEAAIQLDLVAESSQNFVDAVQRVVNANRNNALVNRDMNNQHMLHRILMILLSDLRNAYHEDAKDVTKRVLGLAFRMHYERVVAAAGVHHDMGLCIAKTQSQFAVETIQEAACVPTECQKLHAKLQNFIQKLKSEVNLDLNKIERMSKQIQEELTEWCVYLISLSCVYRKKEILQNANAFPSLPSNIQEDPVVQASDWLHSFVDNELPANFSAIEKAVSEARSKQSETKAPPGPPTPPAPAPAPVQVLKPEPADLPRLERAPLVQGPLSSPSPPPPPPPNQAPKTEFKPLPPPSPPSQSFDSHPPPLSPRAPEPEPRPSHPQGFNPTPSPPPPPPPSHAPNPGSGSTPPFPSLAVTVNNTVCVNPVNNTVCINPVNNTVCINPVNNTVCLNPVNNTVCLNPFVNIPAPLASPPPINPAPSVKRKDTFVFGKIMEQKHGNMKWFANRQHTGKFVYQWTENPDSGTVLLVARMHVDNLTEETLNGDCDPPYQSIEAVFQTMSRAGHNKTSNLITAGKWPMLLALFIDDGAGDEDVADLLIGAGNTIGTIGFKYLTGRHLLRFKDTLQEGLPIMAFGNHENRMQLENSAILSQDSKNPLQCFKTKSDLIVDSNELYNALRDLSFIDGLVQWQARIAAILNEAFTDNLNIADFEGPSGEVDDEQDEKKPAVKNEKTPVVKNQTKPAVEDEKKTAVKNEKKKVVKNETNPAVETTDQFGIGDGFVSIRQQGSKQGTLITTFTTSPEYLYRCGNGKYMFTLIITFSDQKNTKLLVPCFFTHSSNTLSTKDAFSYIQRSVALMIARFIDDRQVANKDKPDGYFADLKKYTKEKHYPLFGLPPFAVVLNDGQFTPEEVGHMLMQVFPLAFPGIDERVVNVMRHTKRMFDLIALVVLTQHRAYPWQGEHPSQVYDIECRIDQDGNWHAVGFIETDDQKNNRIMLNDLAKNFQTRLQVMARRIEEEEQAARNNAKPAVPSPPSPPPASDAGSPRQPPVNYYPPPLPPKDDDKDNKKDVKQDDKDNKKDVKDNKKDVKDNKKDVKQDNKDNKKDVKDNKKDVKQDDKDNKKDVKDNKKDVKDNKKDVKQDNKKRIKKRAKKGGDGDDVFPVPDEDILDRKREQGSYGIMSDSKLPQSLTSQQNNAMPINWNNSIRNERFRVFFSGIWESNPPRDTMLTKDTTVTQVVQKWDFDAADFLVKCQKFFADAKNAGYFSDLFKGLQLSTDVIADMIAMFSVGVANIHQTAIVGLTKKGQIARQLQQQLREITILDGFNPYSNGTMPIAKSLKTEQYCGRISFDPVSSFQMICYLKPGLLMKRFPWNTDAKETSEAMASRFFGTTKSLPVYGALHRQLRNPRGRRIHEWVPAWADAVDTHCQFIVRDKLGKHQLTWSQAFDLVLCETNGEYKDSLTTYRSAIIPGMTQMWAIGKKPIANKNNSVAQLDPRYAPYIAIPLEMSTALSNIPVLIYTAFCSSPSYFNAENDKADKNPPYMSNIVPHPSRVITIKDHKNNSDHFNDVLLHFVSLWMITAIPYFKSTQLEIPDNTCHHLDGQPCVLSLIEASTSTKHARAPQPWAFGWRCLERVFQFLQHRASKRVSDFQILARLLYFLLIRRTKVAINMCDEFIAEVYQMQKTEARTVYPIVHSMLQVLCNDKLADSTTRSNSLDKLLSDQDMLQEINASSLDKIMNPTDDMDPEDSVRLMTQATEFSNATNMNELSDEQCMREYDTAVKGITNLFAKNTLAGFFGN